MYKKTPLLMTLLASSLALTSCATMSLVESTKAESAKQYEKTVITESVIAVGYPSQPIPQYEDAMILAGENYSFLVEPVSTTNTPKSLFKTIFAQVDLKALYIDTTPAYATTQKKMQAASNRLVLNVQSDDSQQIKKVPVEVGLLFVKPVSALQINEQRQLEQLGFSCDLKVIADIKNAVCQRTVPTAITVATAVQNINNVNYKLKQPLTIELNYQWQSQSNNKRWLRVFTPVTVAVDIVTLPIQALGVGVAGAVIIGSLAKHGYQ